MGIPRRLSIALSAALLAGASPGAASPSTRPSFDCRKATAWSEKAICADPALARLDRRIARSFSRAMQRYDTASARAALRTDQDAFLTVRDWLHEGVDGDPKEWLLGHLLERAEFLERIAAVDHRAGFVGTWGNAWGGVQVRPRDDGAFRLVGGVAEPFTARWNCEVDEIGQRHGSTIAFPADAEGIGRIEARMEGGVLVLDGLSGGGEAVELSYCGVLATAETAFFPVGPISDAEPEDW